MAITQKYQMKFNIRKIRMKLRGLKLQSAITHPEFNFFFLCRVLGIFDGNFTIPILNLYGIKNIIFLSSLLLVVKFSSK